MAGQGIPRRSIWPTASLGTESNLQFSSSVSSGYTFASVSAFPSNTADVPKYRFGNGLIAYLEGQDPLEVLGDLDELIDIDNSHVIGKGNFGEVIHAQRKSDGLQLAVKVIPLREAGPSVRREVQTMHALAPHPNLVQLVNVAACRQQLSQAQCEGPYICIVTEFIDGAEPLARVIRRGAQPTLASVVITQLASALDFVHQQGFVHRDVWSENILIAPSGHIVLLDFGASACHDAGPDVTDRLNIPYAAPEASRRARQGPGEDCWAVGLLLSEIVTGQFICDRAGTSTIPAYARPEVLSDLQNETSSLAGPNVGMLCRDLLHMDPKSRIAMKDVPMYFNAGSGPLLTPNTHAMQIQQTVVQDFMWDPPAIATPEVSAPQAALRLSVQQVPTPTKSGCQIPTPIEGQHQCTPGRFSLVHTSKDDTLRHGSFAAPSRVSIMKKCSEDALSSGHLGSSTTGSSLVYPAAPDAGDPQSLSAGMRIVYTARSNGLMYPGVVEGRSSDGKAWCLMLDCGEAKQVADGDLWRIQQA
jgi:serine/threonine protein kinase